MLQDGEEHSPLLATSLIELFVLLLTKALGFSEHGMRCLYTIAPGLRLLSPGTLFYPKQTPTQLC